MSELLWIGVPGGHPDGGRELLRVLVVPKLTGSTLGEAGMATWPPPDLLRAPALRLEWRAGEGEAVEATSAGPGDVGFDAVDGLWEQFFPVDMPLGEGRGEPPSVPLVHPTSGDADAIAATFDGAAAVAFPDRPEDPPPPAFGAAVHDGLAPWQGKADDAPPPRPAEPVAPPPPPPVGFHRAVSLLREHPAVLRALGLIFDVEVAPPPALAAAGQVRVSWPAAPAGGPSIVSPWTRYDSGFLPFSASGAISQGMATLTPDPESPAAGGGWAVATVDVEGGARRLRDAAQVLSEAPTLPAMRTAGIQLVRLEREREFSRRRSVALENDARDSLGEMVLDADDLVLGYRIDIRRGGEDWRSLHERIATYDRGDPELTIGAPEQLEEGHVKVNGAARGDDGTLRATEVVARWGGWSLAVPRPAFDNPGGVRRSERRGGLPFSFGWRFQVPPESLPRLRFGETYAIRARVADMAGGGLGHDDPAAERCSIDEQPYRRYEPVPSPGLRVEPAADPVAGRGEEPSGFGEAFDRIVVRSAPGGGIDVFVAENPGYAMRPERTLLRPRASLAIAEQHRMLDRRDDEQTFAWVQQALAAGGAGGAGATEAPLPDPAGSGVGALVRPQPGVANAIFTRHDWGGRWPQELRKTLELQEPAPARPLLAWEGDALVVRLAPGRQVELELSSTLSADFPDHFALWEAMPASSKKAAALGRHPLVTPARKVTLVHAVRKPIDPPDPATTLTPQPRERGQTFALLDPAPTLFGLDAESTAQLDVTAAWTEHDDEATNAVADASVASLPIDRGATQLREPLRHELGDTRHRRIAYTATAVGRFRGYFDPEEERADPLAFSERRELSRTVSIPSSARPPVPVVLATRPAFTWQQSHERSGGSATLKRQRRGGLLRVELARPWFASGEGERLGVVLWDRETGVQPPEALAPLVTEVGRDPIWDTPGPERWPTEPAFAGAAASAAKHTLAEAGDRALVLPFEPWFDGDRWCADIGLPILAASSYCPFVRLAVARYQPQSIDDHHLSAIVRTEMTQLLPDRTLTVSQEGGTLRVALDGLGPAGPAPNRVDLLLERREAGAADGAAVELSALGPAAGVRAWTAVPDAIVQTSLGAAPVALTIPAGSGDLRLRVREVELVGGTAATVEAAASTTAELAERVIFTDIVALPVEP